MDVFFTLCMAWAQGFDQISLASASIGAGFLWLLGTPVACALAGPSNGLFLRRAFADSMVDPTDANGNGGGEGMPEVHSRPLMVMTDDARGERLASPLLKERALTGSATEEAPIVAAAESFAPTMVAACQRASNPLDHWREQTPSPPEPLHPRAAGRDDGDDQEASRNEATVSPGDQVTTHTIFVVGHPVPTMDGRHLDDERGSRSTWLRRDRRASNLSLLTNAVGFDVRQRPHVHLLALLCGYLFTSVTIAWCYGMCFCSKPQSFSSMLARQLANPPHLCPTDGATPCWTYATLGRGCSDVVMVSHHVTAWSKALPPRRVSAQYCLVSLRYETSLMWTPRPLATTYHRGALGSSNDTTTFQAAPDEAYFSSLPLCDGVGPTQRFPATVDRAQTVASGSKVARGTLRYLNDIAEDQRTVGHVSLTGLACGATYSVRVIFTMPDGSTVAANDVRIRTLPPPPSVATRPIASAPLQPPLAAEGPSIWTLPREWNGSAAAADGPAATTPLSPPEASSSTPLPSPFPYLSFISGGDYVPRFGT